MATDTRSIDGLPDLVDLLGQYVFADAQFGRSAVLAVADQGHGIHCVGIFSVFILFAR